MLVLEGVDIVLINSKPFIEMYFLCPMRLKEHASTDIDSRAPLNSLTLISRPMHAVGMGVGVEEGDGNAK